MAERIDHGTLQHPADGVRTFHLEFILSDGAVFNCSCRQGTALHRRRTVYQEFDPYGRESLG